MYQAPSFATQVFKTHMKQMEPCTDCPEEQSFAIAPKGDLKLALLQQIAESHSVGKKCFVVIEHEQAFEVYRAVDGTPRALLVKNVQQWQSGSATAANMAEPEAVLLNLLNEYKAADLTYVQKYEKNFDLKSKLEGLITASYIQRRLLSTAAFKNSSQGANKTLQLVIESLTAKGILTKIESEDSQKTVYKIVLN